MERLHQAYVDVFHTEPLSIVEIGSRDGHDAEILRKLSGLPPSAVYIAEAHPNCAKAICRDYPDVNLYNVAVFDKSGIMNFNAIDYNLPLSYVGTSSLLVRNIATIPDGHEMTELVKEQNKRRVQVIGITGRMLLELINRSEIDLMKIDVEGATYEVLKSFGDDLRLIKMIHLECELLEVWEGQHLVDDVTQLMQFYGFHQTYTQQTYYNQIDHVWQRTPLI